MFERIRYSGTVVNGLRQPIEGLLLHLRVFNLEDRAWEPISETQSTTQGIFKGSLNTQDFARVRHAPQFQLWDPDANGAIAVAAEPKMTATGLTLNYGMVTRGKSAVVTPGDELDPAAAEELTRLKTKLLAAEIELTDTKARLEAATSARDGIASERDDFKLQLEQIRNADTAAPLFTDLVGQISSSLGDADQPVSEGGFRLADARLTLKGYLSDGGNRFKPLDAAEVASISSAGASEISFSLTASTTAGATTQTMPDMLGLTPSTARRILRPLGTAVQVVETSGSPAGAIISQDPQPGAELPREATVRLEVATGSSEE